jgi:DNA replication and repair protein RecF
MAISQGHREYLFSLQQYVKALAHRNRLLRDAQEQGLRAVDTGVWDRRLLESGTVVVGERLEFLQEIRPLVERNYSRICGEDVRVDLVYSARGYEVSRCGPEEGLKLALENGRRREVRRGHTLCGPHLDDFTFALGGKDVKRFGSEGEQRSAVLALRCAEVEAIRGKLGRYPIVLLDDVFAELDRRRSDALTALISGFDQIVLTSSRPVSLAGRDIHVIRINRGRVESDGST